MLSSPSFRIALFEQAGSAQVKISGIKEYAPDIIIEPIFDLPLLGDHIVIDDPHEILPSEFDADMVLNYLKHPDLSYYLVQECLKRNIPVVASGQRISGAICPFTCCGLGFHKSIAPYSSRFGFPEYRVSLKDDKISGLDVVKGAPCGATWKVVPSLIGLKPEDALILIGRLIQYNCTADPSAFDPITQKSAVHFAGKVHHVALKKALKALA